MEFTSFLVTQAQAAGAGPAPHPSLWLETTDVLKIAALFLAIFVPSIGVFWTLRMQLQKSAPPPAGTATIGTPGMVAIAGALASQETAKIYADEIEALVRAIDRLTDAQRRETEVNKRTGETYEKVLTRWSDVLDEVEMIRKALQTMNDRRQRLTD